MQFNTLHLIRSPSYVVKAKVAAFAASPPQDGFAEFIPAWETAKLLSSGLFQLFQYPPGSDLESGLEIQEEAVVFSSVFRLRLARRWALGAATE